MAPISRSENMRRIRSQHTKPELIVRQFLHKHGYRYALHSQSLPGKPDLVFRSRRKVIFVQGCFWHHHKNCVDGRLPKTREEYWTPKLAKNKSRDAVVRRALTKLGWKSFVIWECEANKEQGLADLLEFLN